MAACAHTAEMLPAGSFRAGDAGDRSAAQAPDYLKWRPQCMAVSKPRAGSLHDRHRSVAYLQTSWLPFVQRSSPGLHLTQSGMVKIHAGHTRAQ